MGLPPYQNILNSITGPILEHMDNLPGELFFFLENKQNNGIFMPHGMSDKGYHKPQRLKTIKHLLYSGPLWKEKLIAQGIQEDRIHVVGCPRLDPIFQGKLEYAKRSPGDRKRVVWCPTHDAIADISSYPKFEQNLNELSLRHEAKYEVISSVHPARRKDHRTSLEVLVSADVVLSDTSSLLYEALAIGKPVILLDWLVKDGVLRLLKGTLEERIYREDICYHAKSFNELPDIIDHAIKKWMDVKTKNFIDGIFPPELRGKSGKVTADTLKKLSQG